MEQPEKTSNWPMMVKSILQLVLQNRGKEMETGADVVVGFLSTAKSRR